MLSNLYMLNFNNYYNRIVKKGGNTIDYYRPFFKYSLMNTNFNPNDGVTTTHNVTAPDSDFDYLIVCDADTDSIISKWFVLEAKRIRIGQYQLTLKRDNIAEKYDSIINSPCIIKRAIVQGDNPLIYNREDMSFNQIKTSEQLLYDNTGIPWIIGYYDRKANEGETDYITGTIDNEIPYDMDMLEKDWKTISTYFNKNNPIMIYQPLFLYTKVRYYPVAGGKVFNLKTSLSYWQSQIIDYDLPPETRTSITYNNLTVSPETWSNNLSQAYRNETETIIKNSYEVFNLLPSDKIKELKDIVGKNIRVSVGDNKFEYYKIEAKYPQDRQEILSIDNKTPLYKTLKDIVKAQPDILWDNQGIDYPETFGISAMVENIFITAKQLVSKITYNIPKTSAVTNWAPYGIFAMPYGSFKCRLKNAEKTVISEAGLADISFRVAMDIVKKYSGENGKLYDIQLLPYCPLNQILTKEDDWFEITENSELYNSIILSEDNSAISVIFNVPYASFSFNIENKIILKNKKIENECDMYRLCSPNWNGQFEFSVAKNNGLQYFNVDCTYKPFSPYIHVNPNFTNLYGKDYNDARGLICNGDFSLPMLNSAWETYERNNVNYQKVFNREIENLEVKQGVQTSQDVIGAFMAPLTGALAGASRGMAHSGGVEGGIIGGVVGAEVGSVLGVANAIQHQVLRDEAMDFKKDMFNFQLGNIKALPTSLARVSAFNENNKYVPVLEYYTCTDKEKQILADKIIWQSMNVNSVGTIAQYIPNEWRYEYENSDGNIEIKKSKGFIRAQLIRYEGPPVDNHEVEDMAKELNDGLFFEVEDNG